MLVAVVGRRTTVSHRHGAIHRWVNTAGVREGAHFVEGMAEGLIRAQGWAILFQPVELPVGPRSGRMRRAVVCLGPVHRCTYFDGKVGKGGIHDSSFEGY